MRSFSAAVLVRRSVLSWYSGEEVFGLLEPLPSPARATLDRTCHLKRLRPDLNHVRLVEAYASLQSVEGDTLQKTFLRIRRRTVELDHHMRLCEIRPFAGTNVWELLTPPGGRHVP
jgi:hypothetical protein